MQEKILSESASIVNKFHIDISNNPSLLYGVGGNAFVYYNLYKLTNEDFYLKGLKKLCCFITEGLHRVEDCSFARGKAGMLYILLYLRRNVKIEMDLALFELYRKVLHEYLNFCLNDFLYDPQDGFIGIGLLGIEAILNGLDGGSIVNLSYNALKKHAEYRREGVCWRYFRQNENGRCVNIGLLHGMGAIVSYLSKLSPYITKEVDELKNLLFLSYRYVESLKENNIYPVGVDYYEKDRLKRYNHRYTYCTGELGVFCYLVTMNKLLMNQDIDHSISIFLEEIERFMPDFEKYDIDDFFFCHGIAGLLYGYCRFFKMTRRSVFLRKMTSCLNFYKDHLDLLRDRGGGSLLSGNKGVLLSLLYVIYTLNDFSYDTGWENVLLL